VRPLTEQRPPWYRPVGDHALLVEFGDTITAETHARVLGLDAALAAKGFDGFRKSVPAYVNVLIEFDPAVADHRTTRTAVEALFASEPLARDDGPTREVLVCYDEEFAPDLQSVARQTGLAVEELIAAHLSGDYCVYMYGFAPGYAYLAGVPGQIQLPRKVAAVREVTAGSVLIAGPQCLVTTLTMPSGWWNIGRSPTQILTKDEDRPFLFDVADHIRFRRIDRLLFESLSRR
jgi:inhibitor of KinA